jgi:hypothetical protein
LYQTFEDAITASLVFVMLRYLSIFIQKQWLSPTAPHPQSPQTDVLHPME